MPEGKPAGVRCVQLDEQNRCRIFDSSDRPAVCAAFKASLDVCGETREQAMEIIHFWEGATGPDQ